LAGIALRVVILSTEAVHADVAVFEAVGIALARDGLAFAFDAVFAIGATGAIATPRSVIFRQLAFAVNTADFDG
jgi:hypothetical protein